MVRRVHGELSDKESLELDREMIRDPRLREWLDQYTAVDSLASAALVGFLACKPTAQPICEGMKDGGNLAASSGLRQRFTRSRWMTPIAIAASVAVAMIIPVGSELEPERDSGQGRRIVGNLPLLQPALSRPEVGDLSNGAPMLRTVARPRLTQRSTVRDVLGVMGADGQTIYFIEIDRTRTTQVSGGGSNDKIWREGL